MSLINKPTKYNWIFKLVLDRIFVHHANLDVLKNMLSEMYVLLTNVCVASKWKAGM